MRSVINFLCLFICFFSALGCIKSKDFHLAIIWGELQEKVKARQCEKLSDEAFGQWYYECILNGELSWEQVRFSTLGFPDLLVNNETSKLNACVVTNEWLKILASSWGKYGDEVYNLWRTPYLNDLNCAIKKECLLVGELYNAYIITNELEEWSHSDYPIALKAYAWIFIYGDEVLLYPFNEKMCGYFFSRPNYHP